jgi:hypothetical protein
VDGSGNAYVAGEFCATIDFDPGPGVDEHTANSSDPWDADAFLSKFDTNGAFLWARTWGGDGIDNAWRGVAIDGSGNIYVTGLFQDTVDFDPGPGIDEHTSNTKNSSFLIKFDSTGDFVFARTWSGSCLSYNCATDWSENIYTGGWFEGTVDFDPGPGTDEHTSNGDEDLCICKLDPAGNFLWARTWGDKWGYGIFDRVYGITADSFDNTYTTGVFCDTVDFDPGPGIYELTTIDGADAYLMKLPPDGNW